MLLNLVWKLTRNSVRVPSASKQFDFLTGTGFARYPACQNNEPARDYPEAGFLFLHSTLTERISMAETILIRQTARQVLAFSYLLFALETLAFSNFSALSA